MYLDSGQNVRVTEGRSAKQKLMQEGTKGPDISRHAICQVQAVFVLVWIIPVWAPQHLWSHVLQRSLHAISLAQCCSLAVIFETYELATNVLAVVLHAQSSLTRRDTALSRRMSTAVPKSASFTAPHTRSKFSGLRSLNTMPCRTLPLRFLHHIGCKGQFRTASKSSSHAFNAAVEVLLAKESTSRCR